MDDVIQCDRIFFEHGEVEFCCNLDGTLFWKWENEWVIIDDPVERLVASRVNKLKNYKKS